MRHAIIFLSGLVFLFASFFRMKRYRVYGALAGLAILLIGFLTFPLDALHIKMGDLGTYLASRGHFEEYMSLSGIQFQAHLSATLLALIDRALGADETSAAESFRLIATFASTAYVAGLATSGHLLGWRPEALRTLALAATMPATLLFFGYQELGYLPLVTVLPALALVDRYKASGQPMYIVAAGTVAGVGTALHGFGLFIIVLSVGILALQPGSWSDRLGKSLLLGNAALAAWLIWIPVYIILMDAAVIPGHAQSVPLRPFLAAEFSHNRVNIPILSWPGLMELGHVLLLQGALLYLPALYITLRRSRAALPLIVSTTPVLLFAMMFWPIQGLGNDTDLVLSAFPAAYALAMVVARNLPLTVLSIALLAMAHVDLWHVLTTSTFVR